METNIRRDRFLNATSPEMLTCTESCIAADLDMPFDYAGKLAENIVRTNFDSFFSFGSNGMGGFEIEDKVAKEDQALVLFVNDGLVHIACNKFTLFAKSTDLTKKAKWEIINVACMLYLGLATEIDTDKYEIKYYN